jgi:hypothetical protein
VIVLAAPAAYAGEQDSGYGAHLSASGLCNGSNCPTPGDGWAIRVEQGPEHGAAQLTSWQFGYGNIDIKVPQALTFADIQRLQADFAMAWGTCAGGSPRFQINVIPPGSAAGDENQNARNIFVYFGTLPSSGVNACPEAQSREANTTNYTNASNPEAQTPGRYDTSQIVPGTQVNNYAGALAICAACPVVGIQIVVDGGWSQAPADFEQQAVVDNVQVNDQTFFADRPGDVEDSDNPVVRGA